MKRLCKHTPYVGTCILFFLFSFILNSSYVYADTPYKSYSYDFWGEDVIQPPAYLNTRTIDSNTMGTSLSYPEDLYVYQDKLYIADTGNSRILILDQSGTLLKDIDSFHNNGKLDNFNNPKGLYVTKEGHIYVADSDNGRIVELDSEGDYIRTIGRPETDLITKNQVYKPTKVVVDKAGRIYVTCYGLNMGLVEFNKQGEFQGFMGAAEVSVSTFDYIWKNYFSTKEQQKRMETIIPTEYSNIYMDNENFIYTTISNLSDKDHLAGADAVRRLNPTGIDVLRRLGNYPIIGDLYNSSEDAKWSTFVDVYATEFGCYYVLDAAGGKVFAYDYDGNSLFIFGGIGNREGNVQNPVAIGLSQDESKLYILDSLLNSILVYDITEYGTHLLSALEKNSIGDSKGAYTEWQEVLKANANSEFAYIGIGKTFLKEGKYKEAMNYFKLGNSRKYYTKAFKFYRKEVMQNNFGTFMTLIGVFLLLLFMVVMVIRIKRWVGEIKCNI